MACPFCEEIDSGDLTAANEGAAAFPDQHPVSPGHTLVVPKRHESDFFALDDDGQQAVWQLLDDVHDILEAEVDADGYSVNIRVGSAAGQTVDHAHVHLIPRGAGRSDAAPR